MLTPQEKQAAMAFWEWFGKNHLPFEFLESMTEEQRQGLYQQGRKWIEPYCPHVDLVPMLNMVQGDHKFQMVITAHANRNYFEKAKELAALAPDDIPNWTARALMPPIPKEVEVRFQFNGTTLYPAELWCQLLENPSDPDFLGIRVSLRYFDHCPENKLEELRQLVYGVVGHVLGEESWALNVQYLDLAPLPLDPTTEDGMFNLYDLSEHIAEFRKDRENLQRLKGPL